MNLLAHAYLSFNEPGVLVGNMISDHVKGKTRYNFPSEIRMGIQLHREIDSYTDVHPATRALKEFFKPFYGLYAAPFSDIVYDYFLANDKSAFPTEGSLLKFTEDTYKDIESHREWLPGHFPYMFSYMQRDNWLFNYRLDEGIEHGFRGLVRRAAYMNSHREAFEIFLANKSAMRDCYEDFFPGLKEHALHILANLKI